MIKRISIIIGIVGALAMAQIAEAGEPWRDANYPYRREIIIENDNMDEPLSNFTLLIKLADADPPALAKANIADGRYTFYDSSGNELHFENESYSEAGTYVAMETWVETVTLNSDDDTATDDSIWIYYGYDGGDQDDGSGAWDANGNWVGVWHLEETSGTHDDSANGNNGTWVTNGGTGTQDATGQIDGADFLDGNGDYISLPNYDINDNEGTFSAWMKLDSVDSTRYLMSSADEATTETYMGPLRIGTNKATVVSKDGVTQDRVAGGTTLQTDTWYHVCTLSNGTGWKIYIDANEETLTTESGANNGDWFDDISNRDNLIIGALKRTSTGYSFNGTIDEVRISSTARSAEWIKFAHANMGGQADNELSWANEENVGGDTVTWDGDTDTDWNDGTNWDGDFVPKAVDNVIIPDTSTTPNDPSVSAGAVCNNLTIETGGILNGGSNTLTVSGNWDSSAGTFNYGTSTVNLINTGTLKTKSFPTRTFYNLSCAYTGKVTTITATPFVVICNVLTLNGGTLAGSNNVILAPIATTPFTTPLVSTDAASTVTIPAIFYYLSNAANSDKTFYVGANANLTGTNIYLSVSSANNNITFALDSNLPSNTLSCINMWMESTGTGTIFTTRNGATDYNINLSNSFYMNGYGLNNNTQSKSIYFNNSTVSIANLFGAGDMSNTNVVDYLYWGGSQINVGGEFRAYYNDGTYINDWVIDPGTSTFTLNGTSTQNITLNKARQASNAFYALTINKSAGIAELIDTLDVNSELKLQAGTLDANGFAMTVAGNWNNAGGTFTHGNNTVTFDGTNNGTANTYTITSGSQPFNHVIFNNAEAGANVDTWELQDAMECNDFTVTDGAPDIQDYQLTINGNCDISGGEFDQDDTGSNYVILAGSSKTVQISLDTYNPRRLKVTGTYTSSNQVKFGKRSSDTHGYLIIDGGIFTINNTLYGFLDATNSISIVNGGDIQGSGWWYFYIDEDTTLPGFTATASVFFRLWGNHTYTLGGDLTISNGSLTNYGNTSLDTSIHNITTSNLYIGSSTGNFSVDLGSGTHTVGGDVSRFAGATSTGNTLDLDQCSLSVGGNWDMTGITVTPGSSTLTLNGTASKTFVGGTGANAYNNIEINKTDADTANDNVTFQTDSCTIGGTLTITDGELIQDPATDISITTGPVSLVHASSKWTNHSDGDVTLSGDVSNAGTITFNAETASPDGILIRSSGGQRNWQGVGGAYSFSMTDVDVEDQTCLGGTPANITVSSGTDNGNNVNWIFGDSDEVSGVVYQDDRTTNVGANVTVGMYIYYISGSTATDTALTGGSGDFSFTNLNLSAGDMVTLYIDNDGSYEGTTVIESNGGDATGVNLSHTYVNLISQNGSITNTELDNADSTDEDIHYEVVGVDLDLEVDSTYNLYITSGTFTPEGDVTVDSANCQIVGILTLDGAYTLEITTSGTLDIDGTLNLDDNAATIDLVGNLDLDGTLDADEFSSTINLAGNWDNAGIFTAGSSTVTLDGISAQTITPTTFYNLEIANTHATQEVTITSGTVTVSHVFQLNDGIFNVNTGKTLDVNFDGMWAAIIASGATLKVNGGTVRADGGDSAVFAVSAGGTLNIDSGGSVTVQNYMTLDGKLQMADDGTTLSLGNTTTTVNALTIGALGGAGIGDITGGTIYLYSVLGAGPFAAILRVDDGGKFLPEITSGDTGNLVVLRQATGTSNSFRNASTVPNFSNVKFNRLQIGDLGYTGTIYFHGSNSAPLNVYNKLTIYTGAIFDHSINPERIYADKFVCDGTYTKTADTDMFYMIDGDVTAANGSISGTSDPSFGNLDIGDGNAVTVTLGRAITADSLDVVANGVLDTGANHSLTVNGNVTNAGTLTLNNSNISIVGNFTNSNTINAGGSTLSFDGAALQTVTSNSATYNNLTITNASGTGVVFADDFTTATLNAITQNTKLTFNAGDTYTITGAAGLNLDGQGIGTEVTLLSDSSPTKFTFNVIGGAQTVDYVNVTDSAASGNDIIATNSINGGGNDDGTGTPQWVFGAVTRYWVGAPFPNNDWDNNNNWSLTSGGAGGVNYPGAIDTAIFDGGDADNCELDANVSVNVIELQGAYAGRLDANGLDITVNSTLDITGGELELNAGSQLTVGGTLTVSGGTLDGLNGTINADNNIILSGGTLTAPFLGNFSIFGDFTISGGASFAHSSGTVIFDGTTTLTSDGEILNNVQIGSAGSAGALTLIDTANIDGNLTVENGGATTLNLGSQILVFNGSTFNLFNLDTFTVAGSTVTFNGGALQTVTSSTTNTYNIITVTNASGAGVEFIDAFRTTTLNAITPNTTLTFDDASTYRIDGAAGLNLDGQGAGTEATILSDNPGNQFTFDVTGGPQTVNYVHVTDSAAETNNITATNSVNNGGNDDAGPIPHWIFSNVTITVPSSLTTVGETPTIIGTAPAGSVVIIKGTVGTVPFQQVASTTADAVGNYRIKQSDYTAPVDLDIGPNNIRAEVGVIQSAVVNINVVAAPNSNQVPTITSPIEGASITSNPFTVNGFAVPNTEVRIQALDANGNLVLNCGSTTSDAVTGAYSISCDAVINALAAGTNTLTVTTYDGAGDAITTSDTVTVTFTDPFGIVFDSVNNNPIGGATVTLYYNGHIATVAAGELAPGDVNPVITGANGVFAFNVVHPPNVDLNMTVTASGYDFPTTKADADLPAGRVILNPASVPPGGSKGEVWAFAGAITNLDLPMDSNNQLITINKEVNKKEAVTGDILTYTVTIRNATASDVTNVYLEDMIPAGFKYINDRAILDNISIPNPTGNYPILFNIGTVSAGQTRVLKYQLIVGSGVTLGKYKNSVVAQYADGTIISNRDSETVSIVLDPLFDLGTIIGKVFWDENENGVQDKGEKPIGNILIATEDGTLITTDTDGKYHLAAVVPGRHVLRIDERTLPEGTYLNTDKVVIVDITPGILSKVNFGVNAKDRKQRTENRRQKTEDGKQKSEDRGQKTEKENEIEVQSPVIARSDDSEKTEYRTSSESGNAEARLLASARSGQAISKDEIAALTSFARNDTQVESEIYSQNIKIDEKTSSVQPRTLNEENRLFFVVMGDAQAGYNFNKGDMEPVGDNDKFKEGFWSEGKFAYYLKGKIKGKYLITSSLDTQRDQKELFRNLDPDKYYPVYGDSSTVNYNATDTQGMLYLLIEWDKSKVLWGNYATGLTDTEFAQFSRTLYGGKIHLESVSATKFGEPNTKLIVFDAQIKQRASHNEFLGTGGSLFYLKNKYVIEGSEKIRIEIRDKITGLVLSSKKISEGFDYEIDYDNGRIIFWQPVSQIAESSSIISSNLLDGNLVYVVVDYEYEVKDEYDKGSQGARVQQSIGDYLTVGGTYVKERQADKDYELKGLDAIIRLGGNIKITAEQAESISEQAENFISTDGGLSFTELPTLDKDKGTAYGIKGEASFSNNKLDLTNYYKKIEEGFSSTSTISQQGKELFGTGIKWDVTSGTKLTISHDIQKLIDDGNAQTQLQTGAQKIKTTSAQITHQREKLRLTGEYRHQFESERLESNTGKNENIIAAKADYKLTDKVEVSLEQQTTFRGETNNQTSVGVSAKPNEHLLFKAKQTSGTDGSATSAGTTVKVDDKTDVHTTVAVADSSQDGQTQSIVFGSQQKLNEELAFTTDKTYSKDDNNLTEANTIGLTTEKDGKRLKGTFTKQQLQNNTAVANTNILGLSGDINDNWALAGSFERGTVQSHDGNEATRNAGALAVSYINKDPGTDNIRIKVSSKLELRNDEGEENKQQYLAYNALECKPTINTTLFAKMNLSQTDNTSENSIEAQYKELVTGVAYRPVYFDRLNLLARYTYLEDTLPSDQSDFSDIEGERAHTLSGELAYDLTDEWQLIEKLAYKFGEEKVTGFDFTQTQTWLMIHRLNYNVNNDWQIGAEYRILTQEQAKDYKQGALLEISRKIGEFVQMGAGYNFTDFNDDLTHLDYTSQGPFVRLTATLYDRTPEEIQLAEEKRLENNIKHWTWELVNKELAKINSPIMQKLYYYYYFAEKFSSEGKLKEAKQLYEKITQTGQIMYNEAEKYIRNRIELEKKIKEANQLALEYYKQGKFTEAKKLWEKIKEEANPEPIFLEFQRINFTPGGG